MALCMSEENLRELFLALLLAVEIHSMNRTNLSKGITRICLVLTEKSSSGNNIRSLNWLSPIFFSISVITAS